MIQQITMDSGWKQHKYLFCIILQYWHSEVWNRSPWTKIKVSMGCAPSGVYSEKPISLLFLVWESPHSFALAPYFKVHSRASSEFSLTLPPPSFSCRKGPLTLHWAHPSNPGYLKILNIITSEGSLLPWKLAYSWVLEIGMWTYLISIIWLTIIANTYWLFTVSGPVLSIWYWFNCLFPTAQRNSYYC